MVPFNHNSLLSDPKLLEMLRAFENPVSGHLDPHPPMLSLYPPRWLPMKMLRLS